MKRSNAFFLAGLVALAVPALALADRVPVILQEASVESTANEVSLPTTESGILTVRACPACSAQTFYFDKARVLMAGGRQVSLTQMIAALRRAGDMPVTVHYRRTDSLVTRIILLTSPTSSTAQ